MRSRSGVTLSGPARGPGEAVSRRSRATWPAGRHQITIVVVVVVVVMSGASRSVVSNCCSSSMHDRVVLM